MQYLFLVKLVGKSPKVFLKNGSTKEVFLEIFQIFSEILSHRNTCKRPTSISSYLFLQCSAGFKLKMVGFLKIKHELNFTAKAGNKYAKKTKKQKMYHYIY